MDEGSPGEFPLPDPCRLGGPDWVRTTGGRLTSAERRRMYVVSLRTQRRLIAERLRRRRPSGLDVDEIVSLPDSRLVRAAEEAATVQSPALLAHGYRTAVFARALAMIDAVDVDHELLVVCGLLHDAGLVVPPLNPSAPCLRSRGGRCPAPSGRAAA